MVSFGVAPGWAGREMGLMEGPWTTPYVLGIRACGVMGMASST